MKQPFGMELIAIWVTLCAGNALSGFLMESVTAADAVERSYFQALALAVVYVVSWERAK